ncbi:unnamed protein product [Paramecium sonneborni]|uniref:Transmembrane protein n=1 Tax=Paramecium sonneborni TaxID=65129 RepID=A0A8S1PQZ5_9CILI|nr:unnamed protein product [Paramecium sonneborni]
MNKICFCSYFITIKLLNLYNTFYMNTANKATRVTLLLANVCCRILFFYFFWLASVDGDSSLQNRQFAFINEMWAWEQYPYSSIQAFQSTECPEDWILLTSFNWPGTKEHLNSKGEFIPKQSSQSFFLWTTTEYQKAFILCGQQIKHNVISTVNSTQTCEDRDMKDCGIDKMQFCIDSDLTCPINSIQIEMNDQTIDILTTNIETNKDNMPISLIRIDSYIPCATKNETNAQPEVQYDENLEEQPQSCLELDKEYIEVNSITDQLYFQINDAPDVFIDKDGTKSLFYKPYPFWNKECNGEMFLVAQKQENTLKNYRNTEYANFILVIVYLLVCNYGIPMIPYIFRCVGPLSLKTLTYLDYLLRLVLSGTMTYLSFANLDYGRQLLDSLDVLWGMQCIKEEEVVFQDQYRLSMVDLQIKQKHKEHQIQWQQHFHLCYGQLRDLYYGCQVVKKQLNNVDVDTVDQKQKKMLKMLLIDQIKVNPYNEHLFIKNQFFINNMFKFGKEKFTKKSLPKNFADQILNLEMEIELNDQVQIELIQDLISLYMEGVEYYESIKDRRHLYFQRKLNALMLKPTFINTTTKYEESQKPKEKDENQIKRSKFQEQTRRIELDLIYSQTESKEAQVKGIVENHTNQVIKIEKIIKNEIANQSDVFQQRLERRRRSKLTHSLSQPEIDLQSQKSGNSNKKKQIELHEQVVQIKQIIHEEDETAANRKDSTLKKTQEKKWEIIHQASIIQDNKKRTNSLISRRRSIFLTTKQLTSIKRSFSDGAIRSLEEPKE